MLDRLRTTGVGAGERPPHPVAIHPAAKSTLLPEPLEGGSGRSVGFLYLFVLQEYRPL